MANNEQYVEISSPTDSSDICRRGQNPDSLGQGKRVYRWREFLMGLYNRVHHVTNERLGRMHIPRLMGVD